MQNDEHNKKTPRQIWYRKFKSDMVRTANSKRMSKNTIWFQATHQSNEVQCEKKEATQSRKLRPPSETKQRNFNYNTHASLVSVALIYTQLLIWAG